MRRDGTRGYGNLIPPGCNPDYSKELPFPFASPTLPVCGFYYRCDGWAVHNATSMPSSEVRVSISRPLAEVFAVYTQPDTWRWCSYLRAVRWVRGDPWKEESRLQIKIDGPASTIDQVLMRFEPNRRVEFLSHFGGITLQTRVAFLALSEKETEVQVQLEFVGVFSRIAGFAVDTAIERSTRLFFEDLKRACEQAPPA